MGCNFSKYVSLFEVNARKDEWLVAIKVLQVGKMKEKKVVEKVKKKLKWSSLWMIHQCF
jgi:hypothetical protein